VPPTGSSRAAPNRSSARSASYSVLATDRQGIAGEGEIHEQAPEVEQILLASVVGQGRVLFAEAAEPAEQMGIAAQLGELEQLRESGLEKGKKVTGNAVTTGRPCSSGSPKRSARPTIQLTGGQPGRDRLRVVSQDYRCTDSRGVPKH
jgi:hypothetical protein